MNVALDPKLLGTEIDHHVSAPVTAAQILEYAAACGETNPLFTDPDAARRGPFGGLVAPPTFVARSRISELRRKVAALGRPGFDAGKDIEFGEPVRPGDVLTSRTVLRDLYRKTGRTGILHFLVLQTTVTNQHEGLVARIEQRMMIRDSSP